MSDTTPSRTDQERCSDPAAIRDSISIPLMEVLVGTTIDRTLVPVDRVVASLNWMLTNLGHNHEWESLNLIQTSDILHVRSVLHKVCHELEGSKYDDGILVKTATSYAVMTASKYFSFAVMIPAWVRANVSWFDTFAEMERDVRPFASTIEEIHERK